MSQTQSVTLRSRFLGSQQGFGRLFPLTLTAFCLHSQLAFGLAGVEVRPQQKPNIVVIITDDQRWDTMGCLNNRVIQTPNLDKLAAQGTLFKNNFCTTSICSVSRASLLTGQYQRRHKIDDFQKNFYPAAWSNTFPAILRRQGYQTAFVGKWGVGSQLPESEFDFWAGFAGQGKYFHPGQTNHLTRRLGEQARQCIQKIADRQPFCLILSFKAPHAQDGAPRPFPPDPQDQSLYRDLVVPLPKTANETYFQKLPDFLKGSEGRTRWKDRFSSPEHFQETVKDYYRLVTGVDREIGGLMKALERIQADENTLIVFTSDNGLFLGERGLADKWLMYEESIRTPLIIRWPRLNPALQGKIIDQMTLNIDLAPTILECAGFKPPPLTQGKSMRPFIFQEPVQWREDWFYEHHYDHQGTIPPSEGVRTKRWKYIRYLASHPLREELYDLKNDPFEEINLARQPEHQMILDRLRGRWAAYRQQLE